MGEATAEGGVQELQRRPPALMEPSRKRACPVETPPSVLPIPWLALPPPQTSRAAELRSQLKEKWGATDKDIDTVEIAYTSLASDERENLPSSQVVSRLKILGDYIEAMARES